VQAQPQQPAAVQQPTQQSSSNLPPSNPSANLRASALFNEYYALGAKVKKMPYSTRGDVDYIIKEWQNFINAHTDVPGNDPCIMKAKEQIDNMNTLKQLLK